MLGFHGQNNHVIRAKVDFPRMTYRRDRQANGLMGCLVMQAFVLDGLQVGRARYQQHVHATLK
jgi:hypothetical protein